MRVIAGREKGRRLHTVSSTSTRPTTDRVKEALFNIIGNSIYDASFLDLFAGNGGIGIEALSRGAKTAVFVEKNRLCTETIKLNLTITSFLDQGEIIIKDVFSGLKILGGRDEKFNFIFLDPPYSRGLIEPTLRFINKYKLLSHNGLVICEHNIKEEIPKLMLKLSRVRTENYGDTAIGFYR